MNQSLPEIQYSDLKVRNLKKIRSISQMSESRNESNSEVVHKKNNSEMGIEGYTIGKSFFLDKPGFKVINWANVKPLDKKTFLDDIMAESKKRLPPNKYASHQDWRKMSVSVIEHGHVRKNLIVKGSRQTLNEEIIKTAKRNKIPAPGAYNLPKERIRNIPKVTTPQLQMSDDCEYKSKQVPGHKYDQLSGFKVTRPKIFALKFVAPKIKRSELSYKIIKSKDPDCGTYDSLGAFKKTQTHRLESNTYIGKCPRDNFI